MEEAFGKPDSLPTIAFNDNYTSELEKSGKKR
jgi:hypothetical protein